MKKKQLLELKKLTATDKMVQMAKEDIPVQKQKFRGVEYVYKCGLYIVAEVEREIFKGCNVFYGPSGVKRERTYVQPVY